MARALFIYDLLHRLPFARSYRSKVALAVLFSVLLPVAAMETWFIVFSPLRGEGLEQAILVTCVGAALASVFAYWMLDGILRPIQVMARQLNLFVNERVLPDLPGHYKDEVGSLMSNVNYVSRNLYELFENTAQTALVDHLTGAYNRRSSESRLRDAVELSRIRQSNLCLAILDLDDFKSLNDNYGHEFGDTVLRQLGELLRSNVRRGDWVGRWGGDEFVIAIQGGESEAQAMLSRICEAVRQEQFMAPNGSVHRLTLSCGVCEWSDTLDPNNLFARADEALYRAKRGGRDQVSLYSEVAA